MTFGFRLHVVLAPGHVLSLHAPTEPFVVGDPPRRIRVRPLGEVTAAGPNELSFAASGFPSLDTATDAGGQLKDAVRLASTLSQVPIDVGEGTVLGGAGQAVKELWKASGIQTLDDVHGLLVYEEEAESVQFVGGGATALQAHPFEPFAEGVKSALAKETQLGQKEALACDLLALSTFETSSRARHITATTAGEVLSTRRPRTGKAGDLVGELIATTRSTQKALGGGDDTADDRAQLEALKSSLEWARNESISSAFRNLAHELPDTEAQVDAHKVLKRAYNVRSTLAHDGIGAADLPILTGQVQSILASVIAARCEPGNAPGVGEIDPRSHGAVPFHGRLARTIRRTLAQRLSEAAALIEP